MSSVNENECEAAGLDPLEVKRIAQGLSRYARQAEKLRIQIFGGSTGGQLRYDDGGKGMLIVGDLDGNFDGGDGGVHTDSDGLQRGEY